MTVKLIPLPCAAAIAAEMHGCNTKACNISDLLPRVAVFRDFTVIHTRTRAEVV